MTRPFEYAKHDVIAATVERYLYLWHRTRFRAQRLGLETRFRAHWIARVKTHLLSIGYFALTLGVSEL